MKIGVTGASGFIGKRIVEIGLEKGFEMVAFVRTPSKLGDLASKIKVFTGDISKQNDAKDFVDYCDVIIHTAAVVTDWAPKEEYQKTNLDGTKYLMEHMIGTDKKLVHTSSTSVYGARLGEGLCSEDMPLTPPLGIYSWAKQEQEKLIIAMAEKHNIKYTMIRASNIFGPGSPSWVIEYAAAMKQGPILIGDGSQKALTYVDNLVELFFLAATKDEANGHIFNGTDNQETTWKEYATLLSETLNWKNPTSMPLFLGKIVASVVPFFYKIVGKTNRPPLTSEALSFVAYNFNVPYTKAQNFLGYKPVINRPEALKQTMDWVKSHSLE